MMVYFAIFNEFMFVVSAASHERHRRSASDTRYSSRVGHQALHNPRSAPNLGATLRSPKLPRRWRACGRDFLAVKADNPEVIEAHQMKIPVIRGRRCLPKLMRLKYGIAVGGAHGKTTTDLIGCFGLGRAGISTRRCGRGRVNRQHDRRGLAKANILTGKQRERPRFRISRRSSQWSQPSTANTSTSTAPR